MTHVTRAVFLELKGIFLPEFKIVFSYFFTKMRFFSHFNI